MRTNKMIDKIVGLKAKKQTLNYEERNDLIEHFLILALEEDDTINPFFRSLAEDIAVLHAYFEFELEHGSMITPETGAIAEKNSSTFSLLVPPGMFRTSRTK